MRIEPATSADLDYLADAWVDLAETQRRHGSHIASSTNRETVRPLLAHHVVEGTVLVARREDRGPDKAGGTNGVIGFANFGIEAGSLDADATRGIVHNLYVEPAFRGEGVGSALLSAAESALSELEADVIAIEALWENEAARRLYRRRGYEPHRVQFEREAGIGVETETEGSDASAEIEKSDTNSKEGS